MRCNAALRPHVRPDLRTGHVKMVLDKLRDFPYYYVNNHVIMDLTTYFNLAESPFRLSPDPRFLYLSESVQETLAKVAYLTRERIGPLYLSGPIGSGKTTLLRRLYGELRDDSGHQAVLLFAPNLGSANAFLRLIMAAFGVKTERSYVSSLRQFEAFLLAQYAAGVTPVLFVDEAQNLPRAALKLVHYLLNFETDAAKLLQVVLAGQEELAEKVLRYRELASRMFPVAINAMTPADLRGMLAFRWLVAGGAELPFDEEALKLLFLASKGLPRDAVKLADEAVRRVAITDRGRVDAALIATIGKELRLI
jgi:general secretion pathway protein A